MDAPGGPWVHTEVAMRALGDPVEEGVEVCPVIRVWDQAPKAEVEEDE
ncbi:MAG: hypothetical protein QXU79_00300 [Candidatus Micrarchaeaceae archaeon]